MASHNMEVCASMERARMTSHNMEPACMASHNIARSLSYLPPPFPP